MVRRDTGLKAIKAGGKLERQDLATLAGGINAVHLEDRLGDVETECRDRLHG
jgi:hypothetical protein